MDSLEASDWPSKKGFNKQFALIANNVSFYLQLGKDILYLRESHVRGSIIFQQHHLF